MEKKPLINETDPCKFLQWDSDFFGRRIARVNGSKLTTKIIEEILAWCEDTHIECLYFLADSDNRQTVQIAEQQDFKLVDIRVTMQTQIDQAAYRSIESSETAIRQVVSSDIEELKSIASNNHTQSRFFYDPCFHHNMSRKLYEAWIEESCKDYADTVLVYGQNDAALGYLTCHLNSGSRESHIGLLGIRSDSQGQGIGRSLVNAGLDWFAQHKQEIVEVVTQGRNINAQRLYQRCGFFTTSQQLWYHKWFVTCDV